jgi:curved DNA-binding protein CbpA
MGIADFYSILQLEPSATPNEIKQAYRKLSKQYHPDVTNNNADALVKFNDIKLAYETLSDPKLRYAYHEERWLQKATGANTSTYKAATATNIYKQLLVLEKSLLYSNAQLNSKLQLSNDLNQTLNHTAIDTINNKKDDILSNALISLLNKFIKELPFDFLPILRNKIEQISCSSQNEVLIKFDEITAQYKKQLIFEKWKWLLILLLMAILLLSIAVIA